MTKQEITLWLDDNIIAGLKFRANKLNLSASEYLSQVICRKILEEQEDLRDIKKSLSEPNISFTEALKILGIDEEMED